MIAVAHQIDAPAVSPADRALLERLARVRALRSAQAKEDRRIRNLPLENRQHIVEVREKLVLIDTKDGKPKSVTLTLPRNINECWLSKAWWKRWVSQQQYNAGMELRNTYERSMLHTNRALDYTLERVDGGGNNTEIAADRLSAAHRYSEAVAAMDRADYPAGRICAAVAIEDVPASRLEERYRWRNGTGMQHIRVALDMLGEWWWGRR